jgi:hypothetical protein
MIYSKLHGEKAKYMIMERKNIKITNLKELKISYI